MFRRSSTDSNKSIESYASILSDDSYLKTLKPGIDDQFEELLGQVRMTDSHRKILKERKIQSHKAKKRDPNDVDRRLDWTPQMEEDYASYKSKVEVLHATKVKQEASEKAAKKSARADLATQERARHKALENDKKWLDAALVAATARLSFMTKYPNALNTKSTQGHVKAAQDNLNSVKKAARAIETQKRKIAEAREIAARQAASSDSW